MNTNQYNEQEWLAQERARIAARKGDASPLDPLAARYRRVAEALREPLPDALPADFAASLARQVAHPAPVADEVDEPGFERSLTRLLIGVLACAGAVIAAMYGAKWLPPIAQLLQLDSAGAVHWAIALVACVGASWLVEQIRRHHGEATHAA